MKKRTFTLLEIIIVIFLITLITGAIGYNLKGTMEKGRVFRTEQAQEQLHDLLLMCLAEGETPENIVKNPINMIRKYGLAKNPDRIVEDGWGERFKITTTPGKNDFRVSSEGLKEYYKKMNKAVPDDSPGVQ
jgi:type II secretory pathway pseudopilin PulG